jgi:hypothetical protein
MKVYPRFFLVLEQMLIWYPNSTLQCMPLMQLSHSEITPTRVNIKFYQFCPPKFDVKIQNSDRLHKDPAYYFSFLLFPSIYRLNFRTPYFLFNQKDELVLPGNIYS